jgi:3-dehydroquinate synthase
MSEIPAQPAHSVHVDLGSRSYRVDVGHGLLKNLGAVANERFGNRSTCAVITDSKVGPLYAAAAVASLEAAGRRCA